MEKVHILQSFQEFLKTYNMTEKDEIWQEYSHHFQDFWNKKIINPQAKYADYELEEILRMIDRHASGNTQSHEAIARMLISQGTWKRMFDQLKTDTKLAQLVNDVMTATGSAQRSTLINELYVYNEPFRNSLTGKKGNALNAFLYLWSPNQNVSVVSLGDRQRMLQFFGFENGPDFETDSQGDKIVKSNLALIDGFADYFGGQYSPRTVCVFLYHDLEIRNAWRGKDIGEENSSRGWSQYIQNSNSIEMETENAQVTDQGLSLFVLESHLEDFLIENWEHTELGAKYDLYEEDGEIGQQYPTGVGRIDILAQDKQSKQLVVIELKKNQTSDDTVGQLARYMGWLEEHKTGGQETKGIIIAAQYDERLYYALKQIRNTEVYLYRVNFMLKEFQK